MNENKLTSPNVVGSAVLFTSNILVCAALILLRHSDNNSTIRSVYLLAANAVAGVLGLIPFREENRVQLDRPTLAVAVWSACYCAEYGIFLVYPGVISLSQLIVCNSMAPFAAVYVSRDTQRTTLGSSHRFFSIVPIVFLIGISYIERLRSNRYDPLASLILIAVFLSVVISQSCARYVARNRSPSWSQPRLTLLNAIVLTLILSITPHYSIATLEHSVKVGFCLVVGVMILLIQRLYLYGLKQADPFISAMTLCTIVPLSLGAEFIFEHRTISPIEIALAVAYVLANAVSVKMTA